jgi:hypothetical protein
MFDSTRNFDICDRDSICRLSQLTLVSNKFGHYALNQKLPDHSSINHSLEELVDGIYAQVKELREENLNVYSSLRLAENLTMAHKFFEHIFAKRQKDLDVGGINRTNFYANDFFTGKEAKLQTALKAIKEKGLILKHSKGEKNCCSEISIDSLLSRYRKLSDEALFIQLNEKENYPFENISNQCADLIDFAAAGRIGIICKLFDPQTEYMSDISEADKKNLLGGLLWIYLQAVIKNLKFAPKEEDLRNNVQTVLNLGASLNNFNAKFYSPNRKKTYPISSLLSDILIQWLYTDCRCNFCGYFLKPFAYFMPTWELLASREIQTTENLPLAYRPFYETTREIIHKISRKEKILLLIKSQKFDPKSVFNSLPKELISVIVNIFQEVERPKFTKLILLAEDQIRTAFPLIEKPNDLQSLHKWS